MNRMELDDFCAKAGTNNRKDDDKWRERNTPFSITQSVMQQSRYRLPMAMCAATAANSCLSNTEVPERNAAGAG